MIYTKFYRIVYELETELYTPQIGFRWRWFKWLPFSAWYYAHTSSSNGYDWSGCREPYGCINTLSHIDIDIVAKNLQVMINHYDGIANHANKLKQSMKEFNKQNKHKVKIV